MKKNLFFSTFFALFLTFCENSGYFELQVRKGTEFWPRIDVCLKEFFLFSAFSSKECTFGEKSGQTALSLKIGFTFRWTGSFSARVRFHGSDAERPETEVFLAESDSKPTNEWKEKTFSKQLMIRFRVKCNENYFGSDCATFCRSRDDTFGHFRCEEKSGRKVCLKGWKARDCDKPECSAQCNEMHGFCEKPFECTCRTGWKGPNCDECVPYPGCKHGFCLRPFECTCERNWGGILCDQDLDYCGTHAPCLHESKCENVSPNAFRCLCRRGFSGLNCQHVTDVCQTQPCLHGGVCLLVDTPTNTNDSAFTCQCLPGFEGLRCEREVNECVSNPCLNGGTCLDLKNAFRCQCLGGWTGSACESDLDECAFSPCVHSTHCSNTFGSFHCHCQTGFDGQQCESEINECLPVTCHNGGQCLDLLNDFRCVCRNHFFGTFCQQVDPRLCSSGSSQQFWSFEDSASLCGQKACLCNGGVAQCVPQCPINITNNTIMCSSRDTSIELEFNSKPETEVICATLSAMETLLAPEESRDLCCRQSSANSVAFGSRSDRKIISLIESNVWSDLKRISFTNNVRKEKTFFYWNLIPIFVTIFAIISIIIVFFVRKRRLFCPQETENTPEVVIHCIQNNLKTTESRESIQSFRKLF